MKNVTTKLMSLLLAGLLVVTMIPTEAFASEAKSDATVSTETEVNFPETSEIVPEGEEFQAGYRELEDPLEVKSSSNRPNKATIPSAYHSTLDELSKYPVTRDQNPYGTCWAHAALACAEFSMIEQGKAKNTVDYSELALAYFTYNTVKDPFGGTDGDINEIHPLYKEAGYDYLTLGGNSLFTTRILAGWVGATKESNVPYSDAAKSLTEGVASKYAYKNNTAVLENAKVVDIVNDRSGAKELIMENGALAIAYYYDYNYDYNGTYYCPKALSTNHAVAVVGWDDNYSKDNFLKTPAGDGAWLVRNSWDATGNSVNGWSYFWLSYYDATLSPAAFSYEFMSATKYDNNVQHDGAAFSYPTGYAKAANIFKVHQDGGEILKAVQLCVMNEVDIKYTIEIYKDVLGTTDPTNGVKVASATTKGTTSYQGIYTIPLKKSVELEEGTKYSVVVTYENSYWGVEAETSLENWLNVTASADKGESFVYKPNYGWADVVNVTDFLDGMKCANIAVKALTNDVDSLKKPTNVKASLDDTGIKLTWSKVSGAKSYKIYRKTSSASKYSLVDEVTTNKFVDNTVKYNSKYNYYVVAVAGVAKSSKSAVVTKKASKLFAPANVIVEGTSTSSVKVSWSRCNGADGYYVYRATSKTGTYKQVAKIKKGSTVSYKDTSVKKGKVYYYKVKAYKGSKKSVYSSVAYGSPMKTTTKMKTTVNATASTIKISWTKDSNAKGYYVYRRESSSDEWEKIKTITSKSTTSYTDKDVSGKYQYAVAMYKTVNSKKCASAKTTAITTRTLRHPSCPQISVAEKYDVGFGVSWSKVSYATGYQIYAKKSSASTYKLKKTISGGSKTYGEFATEFYEETDIKVRAIYKSNGVTTYGPFSDVTVKWYIEPIYSGKLQAVQK